jgi:hypothetical protein
MMNSAFVYLYHLWCVLARPFKCSHASMSKIDTGMLLLNGNRNNFDLMS